MSDDLPFTGERFVPGTQGEIWIEHWHRYHFATRWIAGKRVLDVACGEGYGSALLARQATQVTGVDISAEAVDHARKAYAGIANLAFECGSCTALPLADSSVDVAVSFETIEHIEEQEAFLAELARVMTPEGVLVLSCPNKLEYTDRRDFKNPFHVKELYREELARLVAAFFPHSAWYGQRPTFFSLIAPDTEGEFAAQVVEIDEKQPAEAAPRISNPLYFVLVASRSPQALAAIPGALSVLADRGDWVHRDYEKVMGYLEASAANGKALEQEVAKRNHMINELQLHAQALRHEKEELRGGFAARDARIQALESDVAARQHALEAAEREVTRRRGWRWWLKLPFIRLGLMK